ncbi:Fatty acid hydroxylase [Corchorus capsularis]|uniref:Fatty acid hydroxylase n=1 Tax=Corchorus capsularis TaxID=210143 RepID=A0A1R3I902_COCAP|nr:Fatty acid hydroxylase [Corchorus capsularis]
MDALGFLLSDEFLGAIMPVVVFWVYSGFYLVLEPYCHNYRLHSKQDEDKNNLVSKSTAIKGTLLQQFLQAAVALLLFVVTGPSEAKPSTEEQSSSFMVLVKQIIIAMLVIDTYQYFVHRLLHHNKFLYRRLHSIHHRLVVPYAFGALYSHPFEAFLFDTVGGSLSFLISGMSPRTAIYFFSLATIKTVDDHCGIILPGNPFHILFRNNTAYHDLHHHHGGKYNFSQPFFIMWDKIMGTHMTYTLEKRVEGGFEAKLAKDLKEK